VSGTERVGETLTAADGAWTGTAPITYGHHWQRCDAQGANCRTIPGANRQTYTLATADEAARVRVVVTGGNWIASVTQAASAPTGTVAPAPPPPASDGDNPRRPGGGTGGTKGAGGKGTATRRLRLASARMSPRRFKVAHRRPPKGTRLDGARLTFTLNKPATVRLRVQRRLGHGRHAGRWIGVGAITRSARAGTGVVRFTGRFGARPLPPRRYRMALTATHGRERSGPRYLTFTVVRP
jgi:hypothetical protein